MNKQIEALKMAIEALESIELLCDDKRWYLIGSARKYCKEALAEAEKHEPVAWMYERENGAAILEFYGDLDFKGMKAIPLYTHPATWQSLSDEEKWNLINNSDIPADYDHEVLAIAHAIDAKLKEKNQ